MGALSRSRERGREEGRGGLGEREERGREEEREGRWKVEGEGEGAEIGRLKKRDRGGKKVGAKGGNV